MSERLRGHGRVCLLLPAVALSAAACLPSTSKDAFVGSRDLIICDGVFPLCRGKRASCRLDEDSYIAGELPAAREFMVETPPGTWLIRISLFLDPTVQPRTPGTETEIFWYEPGCAQVYHYQLTADRVSGNLFEAAGSDNVFEEEHIVRKTGDHLIQLKSDASSSYLLRADVIPVDE